MVKRENNEWGKGDGKESRKSNKLRKLSCDKLNDKSFVMIGHLVGKDANRQDEQKAKEKNKKEGRAETGSGSLTARRANREADRK